MKSIGGVYLGNHAFSLFVNDLRIFNGDGQGFDRVINKLMGKDPRREATTRKGQGIVFVRSNA